MHGPDIRWIPGTFKYSRPASSPNTAPELTASPQYCPSVKTTTYYSQVKKANGGFYKVGKDAKIAVGMVKAGNLQKDLGPRKTPKSAAGEY